MKILIVNTFYYPNMVGGTEQSVKLLAEGLQEKGHEVFVLTADKENSSLETINNINIIRLDFKNKSDSNLWRVTRKVLEFNNLIIASQINKILDDIKPDIVHTNNLFYISTIIWKLAKKKNIKVVHTVRDYWGMCPKTTLLNKQGNICKNRKWLCNIHKINYKVNMKYVDILTSPSQFTLDLYKDNNMFSNSQKVVIPNAIDFNIDVQSELVNEKLKISRREINFLFIGTLDIHKGIIFLIETFMGIENEYIKLFVCGDGPLKSYVEECSQKDTRIKYMGKVYKKDKEKILLDSDVMIVPSIWYEPFGRVVIEGYKYSLPVIGCEIGGIKELLNKSISISVIPNKKESLKFAIERLADREILKSYIKNTGMILKKFNIKDQISSFEEQYFK